MSLITTLLLDEGGDILDPQTNYVNPLHDESMLVFDLTHPTRKRVLGVELNSLAINPSYVQGGSD